VANKLNLVHVYFDMKLVLYLLVIFLSCNNNPVKSTLITKRISDDPTDQHHAIINVNGTDIISRFPSPPNFHRDTSQITSFQNYLIHLPLKKHGSLVHYYNGSEKSSQNIHAAVVDYPIGHKNLHQCADAIIKIYAEYFYKEKKYDQLNFRLTNGEYADYQKWIAGYRPKLVNESFKYEQRYEPADTREIFESYLEFVFIYAGTYSVSKQIKERENNQLQIGDIIVEGGFPGHAVLIIDKVTNNQGESLYLLGQSYMPAQEFHILKNGSYPELSPWFKIDDLDLVPTPEWKFINPTIGFFPS